MEKEITLYLMKTFLENYGKTHNNSRDLHIRKGEYTDYVLDFAFYNSKLLFDTELKSEYVLRCRQHFVDTKSKNEDKTEFTINELNDLLAKIKIVDITKKVMTKKLILFVKYLI